MLLATVQGQTPSTVYLQPSDWPSWNPSGSGYTRASLYDTTQGDGGNPQYAIAYDSFTLPFSATITEVTWRGGYSYRSTPQLPPPTQGSASAFTVTIYPAFNDPAAEPDTSIELSRTVANAGSAGGPAAETIVGQNDRVLMCEYRLTLSTPVQAQAGVKYWISIVAHMAGTSPEWGWGSATRGDLLSLNWFSEQHITYRILNDLAFGLQTPSQPPFAVSELVRAVRLSAQVGLPLGSDFPRLDVATGGASAGAIDCLDAVRIARRIVGLDAANQ